MIPPANMIQEDTMGKENERDHREPQSPTSFGQQESKDFQVEELLVGDLFCKLTVNYER